MLFGKYINKYYLKYGIFFIIGVIALVAVDWVQLYLPEFLGKIVKYLDIGYDTTKQEIINLSINVIGVAIIMFLGRVIWRFTLFHASYKIESDLRHEMFLKAERLSQRYYHENKVGAVMAWFTNDLETVEEVFGWGSVMIVDAFFLSVLVVFKMVKLSIGLSLFVFIPAVLIVIWGLLVEKYMENKWRNRQEAFDELFDFSQETFTGIRVIKAFVKETQELHAFAKVAKKNKDINVNFVKVSVCFDIIIEIIIALMSSMILGFGGWFVYSAWSGTPINIFGLTMNIDTPTLVTFLGYSDSLIWPMAALGQIVTMRSRAKASLKRITNFLDEPEDIKSPENAIELKDVKGAISFNKFTFTYPNQKKPELIDITLDIKPGETIGIVGKIGCGKTTLVNSLLRIYNVEKGAIKIDGNDIMDLDIVSLRNAISYVPQDNFLFSNTIENNINFYDENQGEETAIKGAKFSDVHDDIVGFKDGYQTIMGERGVTLSGGQKQRVSLARAYVKNAPILILDDSVSAVDVKTEEKILDNIKTERAGMTTLVIASRVSTVSAMDRIIVLKDGMVEAFDTPENLMSISKTYRTMVYLQKLKAEMEGGKQDGR